MLNREEREDFETEYIREEIARCENIGEMKSRISDRKVAWWKSQTHCER